MTPRAWLYTQLRGTAVLAAISFGFLFVAPRMDTRDFSEVETMQPASVESLAEATPGSEVVVEGKIPSDAPTRNGLAVYVAYLVEHSTSSRQSTTEKELERSTPMLDLEVGAGRVRLDNDRYVLKQVPVVTRDGSLVRRGLAPGDPVVVFGSVVPHDDGVRLRAQIVAHGTKKSYVHNLKGGRRLNRNIGLFFAGFAGLVFALSTRSAIKRSRRGEYVTAR